VSRLCAVVVNYETADATLACVAALRRSRRAPDAIFVIDNGSRDRSVERLRASLGADRLLVLDDNQGFAAGSNHGLRAALADGAERLLLLNSDALVHVDALGRLEQALDADPHLGIVGPTIISGGRIESRGIRYSRHTGRMFCNQAGDALEPSLPDEVRLVDAVSGCAMLIARTVLEHHGLLDEEYFYSFEDVDLCLRATRGGQRSACVTAARVEHDSSLTIGPKSPRRIYFATRNHLRLSRASGAAVTAPLRQALVLGLNLLHVLVRAPAPRVAALAAVSRGVRDHLLRRYGQGS
jgi:N-acetylglucosaminyl-diphospho-decaprenol L-rhamnosyltransferase